MGSYMHDLDPIDGSVPVEKACIDYRKDSSIRILLLSFSDNSPLAMNPTVS